MDSPIANYTPFDKSRFNKKDFPLFKIFLCLVIVFLILSLSSIAAIAYTDWRPPFVNKKLAIGIKILFAHLPLLPKTKKQIVYAAAYQAAKTKTFNMNTSGNVSLDLDNLNLDLNLNLISSWDFTSLENLKMASSLKLAATFLFKEYSLQLQSITTDNATYIKIEKVMDEVFDFAKQYLSSLYDESAADKIITAAKDLLLSKWILVERKKLDTQAKKEVEREKNRQMVEFYTNLGEELTESDFLNKVTLSKNKQNYLLEAEYNGKEFVREIKKALLKEGKVVTVNEKNFYDTLEKVIKKFKITFEIDKKSYNITKNSLILSIELSSKELTEIFPQSQLSFLSFTPRGKITASLVGIFSDHNQPKDIRPPKEVITSEEVLKKLTEIVEKNRPLYPTLYEKSSIKFLLEQTAKLLEIYFVKNFSYPNDFDELFQEYPNYRQAYLTQYEKYHVTYLVSSDKKKYLLYAPYGKEKDKLIYIFYTAQSENQPQFLSEQEINQKIGEIKGNVLGAFIQRFFSQ